LVWKQISRELSARNHPGEINPGSWHSLPVLGFLVWANLETFRKLTNLLKEQIFVYVFYLALISFQERRDCRAERRFWPEIGLKRPESEFRIMKAQEGEARKAKTKRGTIPRRTAPALSFA
jgi:hypothetical protein